MCEVFHCTPREALAQDPVTTFAILELISAREAVYEMRRSTPAGQPLEPPDPRAAAIYQSLNQALDEAYEEEEARLVQGQG